jgi:hypothetical protein
MKDLKKVLSYLKYDKKDLILSMLLIVVECAFELVIPFVMKDIINKGIEQGNMNAILMYGGIVIGCAILSVITGHMYSIFNARAISNYIYHLRLEVYKSVQGFSFANLDHFETSSLITRTTNDIQVIQQSLSGSIRPLLRGPMAFIMGVGLSFVMAPNLAWIFCIALPILAVIMYLIIRYTAPRYAALQSDIDNLNLVVRENVTAIRTVKSYVREDYEKEKFDASNQNVCNTTTNTIKISALSQPSFQLIMYAVTIILLSLGTKMVHNNSLEVGTLSALLSYILQVVNSIMMLSNVFILMNRSFASASRIAEVLDEKPLIRALGDEQVKNGDIEFKNVSFKYKSKGEECALKNINLAIKQGKSIGIMGGTGSSKTTLVSLILRLYDVTDGEVLIDNINVKNYNLSNLRDSIAIVLQNNVLFTGTVRDNLKWGKKNASDEEINEALKMACAYDFVYALPGGLDYDLGQGGVNVSGGQRQRLCIARALLKHPKIIIFDDSTSACDMETERSILKHIRSIKNVTNIIIGQRVSSVMDADEIIILDDGQIVARGPHKSLYNESQIYKELCDTQLGGVSNGSHAS